MDANAIWKWCGEAAGVAGVIKYFIWPVYRTCAVAYKSLTNHIPHLCDEMTRQGEEQKKQTVILERIARRRS